MASSADLDFNCPVCLEVYKNPVVLSCSHSFCKACLQDWWTEKVTRECPVCKRRSSRTDPPCNLVLKNLCEAFSQQTTLRQPSVQPVPMCPQHNEKLQLFCVDHQQLVCLVCRDSRAHHKHRFSPVDEVAQEYREKLRKSLKPLQDRLKQSSEVRQEWDRVSEHIKQQGQHTERMIQKQFDQMREFLQKEEQARITALRTEVQQKISLMEQRLAALNQELAALSESITQTEKLLQDQDTSFLQNYNLRQVPQGQSVPELPCGSLVNVAKHLGNLGFNIWNKMKELVSYSPVILDPNTAHSQLLLSDDLCGVQFGSTSNTKLPDNKERFNEDIIVLGLEGFRTGAHSWEVDIQNNGSWAVGVMSESSPRKGDITIGYWDITFTKGTYTANAQSFTDNIHTKNPLQRIRVHLDMDKGKVFFFDAQTESHIYTFTYAFKDKMFPFINTTHPQNIRFSPVNVQLQN